MPIHKKGVSLSRYWTVRYAVTIVIGVVILSLLAMYVIRQDALNTRLDTMTFLAEDLAVGLDEEDLQAFADSRQRGRFRAGNRQLMNLEADVTVVITDEEGRILFRNDTGMGRQEGVLEEAILNSLATPVRLGDEGSASYYAVSHPVRDETGGTAGFVVMKEKEAVLTEANEQYTLLAIVAGAVILFGVLVTAVMARRLSMPIQEAANAAQRVRGGDYETTVPASTGIEEVDELNRSFSEMTRQLSDAEQLRKELLAGVTHELKTPITAITGLLEAVQEGVVEGEEAEEFLAMSLTETAQLKRMITDLLTFNQFSSGHVPIRQEAVELKRFLEGIIRVGQADGAYGRTEIDLICEEAGGSCVAQADPMRLEQVLHNLIRNASEAMDGEGAMTLRCYSDSSSCVIEVRDDGPGMPIDDQLHMFERFYRGTRTSGTKTGLGLGLPLSCMMMEAMDGRLAFIESGEQGTVFRLFLCAVNEEGSS
ncbi:sensor histidine kinase [Salisediminibacterium selenitireducens]|uniref:histidine kinase n=1 Tax=Bacillus selenitireducens (strain ATCC 700615 / DSM 15326 / MLS10) TaxID=439292 RepID=D6XWH3_BACIE|nr:HAMP domain-containing sensor histidine kinase [Salisediminibacterium selenitireducens]ADH97815.1 integral membrane sensor signal transduction histidine kinase [[Bacillus] selenitireducens MLS10]